jgi:hypothetical protein
MTEAATNALPLLFTYSRLVAGQGFLADVTFCGRVLAWQESDGVWLDGVNPGGFAAGGKTFTEANVELRDTLSKVLIDFALESGSFLEFKREIERFYHETDSTTENLWANALEALKDGRLLVPTGLPRKPAGWQCTISIESMRPEQLTARHNLLADTESQMMLADAA